MKSAKIILFLLFSIIYSQTEFEIRNGETIELPLEATTFIVDYHFIVPESEIYENAILIFKVDYPESPLMYMSIIEDDSSSLWICRNDFASYNVKSIKNNTISFIIRNNFGHFVKFTLLDLTKDIKTSLDNLKNIIPSRLGFLSFYDEPICKFNYAIEEISSDQTYFFLENEDYSSATIFGEGIIEYCEDKDCQNNNYYASKVIKFKKGSKYKMKINYIKYSNFYYFHSFKIMKYSEPKELKYGALVHNIDKSNLDHFYIINSKIVQTLKLYCKSYESIKYSLVKKEDLITNLPNSLNQMEFLDYTPLSEIKIYYDVLIILTDTEIYDKNVIYNYHNLVNFTKSFETFNFNKGYYNLINLDERYLTKENNIFIIIQSSKPSLKPLEDLDSFEEEDFSSQIVNNKKVLFYNQNEDVIIKIRFYQFDNNYNYIKIINNDKLKKYLNYYGNSDSLFLRLKSDNSNYYGFATVLALDLESKYYLYFKQYNGNGKVYNHKIDDNTNFENLLRVIPSYEENDKFSLINNKLSYVFGSQLFSTYLDYGFYCDIYIQKVDDNQNIISFNDTITGNLVKLLMPKKDYYLNFDLNHMVKLDNDYSDAQVKFYGQNNEVIEVLDTNTRNIQLKGNNIKVISNVNALIYFYSNMESDKKTMHEIVFEKSQLGKNMKFVIVNKDSDDQNITLIKDYGFEKHYPMLNSKSWDIIFIEKNKETTIYIENPYDKLDENELNENEKFIIYIGNAFDEDGRPYFEEEKFEIQEIYYTNNSISKYNKFNFQVIEMNKNKSIILSQSNKNKIYYQMAFCDNYYSYNMDIDYSNSNVDETSEVISSNKSISINLENYEIMNHRFYTSNGNKNLLFYYSFENNVKPYGNAYVAMYLWLKALDDKYLEARVWSDNKAYYRMYIVVSLVDDDNNLSTFNKHCYLSKLITENTNSNYILKTVYYDFSSSNSSQYILTKIDISSLNINTSNKFVINVINEDLSNNKLQFNSALECIPERTQEIKFSNVYTFGNSQDLRKNNYFKFNYNDENQKEFVLALKTLSNYDTLVMDIYIEGPDISIKQSIKKSDYYEICFNLTTPGVVYIKFIMTGGNNGQFNVLPLKKTINIIDFKEKIYFHRTELFTQWKHLIYIYNVTGLTEDRTVYFVSEHNDIKYEVCDISSNKCSEVEKFYKFLSNKIYNININSQSQLFPYVFGIFNFKNLISCKELGILKNNEPTIYLTEKKYFSSIDSFQYVNINSYLGYYREMNNNRYKIDEIKDNLQSIFFRGLSYYYDKMSFYSDDYIIFFFIPNFNYRLGTFGNFTVVFCNKRFYDGNLNAGIQLAPGENAIIELYKFPYSRDFSDYYNALMILKSQNKNMAFVDYNSNGSNKFNDMIIYNSIDKFPSKYVYIDKSDVSNFVKFFYFEARYSYFYALNEITLNNRTKSLKEKGYNSYFKRENSNIAEFYDFFNKMIFDINDKVNVYFKTYFGSSNLYEINLDSYDITNPTFVSKPIKSFENERSILNKLFSLESNKLFSGHLDPETLYDIYFDIDNEDNIVEMQEEDNLYNNLIKLFKPGIEYTLDFEVTHLIKLDPNFDTEVSITDSKKTIILSKTNPKTVEIEGINVKITTKANAILYFYNSLDKIKTKNQKYKNMNQHEIIPKNNNNIKISIQFEATSNVKYIYYLVDVGFEGFAPLDYKSFEISKRSCSGNNCILYFSNNYNKLKTELIEGEKLFLYYYIDDSINISDITFSNIYSDSLRHINNNQHFYVIPKNVGGSYLVIESKNIKEFSFQAHYCPNNDGTNPTLTIDDSRDIKLEDSKITKYSYSNGMLKLNVKSNFEFVFSYSLHDKAEDEIRRTNWETERTVTNYLNIKTAEINFNKNMAKVQFIPNYIKSSTRYYIVVGPKNNTFTLESFNNLCFLAKLITENSNGAKVYEAADIGDEYIDVNIDIKDLITENENNRQFIVNVISSELRFDKGLNIYKPRLFETPTKIEFNNEINFNGKDLYFDLDYYRSNNTNEIFLFFQKSMSSNFKLIVETPNLEVKSFIVNDILKYYLFETYSDGLYSINIISLKENEPTSGIFKILSTGVPIKVDIEQNLEFEEIKTSMKSSPLIFTFDLLKKAYIKKFNIDNDEPSKIVSIKKNNDSFIPINNNNKFYTFEEGNSYSIQVKLQKEGEEYILNKFELNNFSEDNIEYLMKSNNISFNKAGEIKFILFNLKNFTKLKVIQKNGESIINIANLTENQYNIFPREIQNIIFEKSEKNSHFEINKNNNNEYLLLMINLLEDSTEIEFKFEEDKHDDDDEGLSIFQIAIISVSCFLFIVFLAIIIIYLRKRKNNDEIESNFKEISGELNEMKNEERLYNDN